MTTTGRPLSRRNIIKHLAAAGIGAVTAPIIFPAKSRAACPMRIRRNINDPQFGQAAADAYREAVGKLKALPPSNPRNWLNLADIHRNFCPHGNWYFLPWHRAYLHAVEEICADITANQSFALPYWDWTTFRQLPRAFVDATVNGQSNPLFHQARKMGKNDTLTTMLSPFGVDAEVIFGAANIATIKGQPDFQSFGSTKPPAQDSLDSTRWQRERGRKTKLESEPHDFLRGAVGGDMGNPTVSPKDPIFYLHHCNLDRIWDDWQGSHGDDSDPLWKNFVFKSNFPTATGAPGGDVLVSSIEDSTALCYRYDTSTRPAIAQPRGAAAPLFRTLGTGRILDKVNIAIPSEASVLLPDAAARGLDQVLRNERDRATRIWAFIDDVRPPKNKNVNVRVFVNCDYLTPLTPADDPHYSGGFTFFVMPDHEEAQSFAIDLTDTVRKLRSDGGADLNNLRVQLMPVTYDGKPAEGDGFTVGPIQIAFASAQPNPADLR